MANDRIRVSTTKCQKSNDDVDRISDLPIGIISHILSRLPIMDALRTSVLSKEWEFKWTTIDKVVFNDLDIKNADETKFLNFMEKTILNLGNIERFTLWCTQEHDLGRLTAVFYSVFRRNVRRFRVDMTDDEGGIVQLSRPIVLPRSLLNCASLEKLILSMLCIFKVPVRTHFPNLRKFKLSDVEISHMNTMPDSVFFSFPVLEHFELANCEWSNVKSVEIYAPKLIKYICEPNDTQNYEYSIKIVGAKLEEFRIYGPFVENFDLSGSTVMDTHICCSDINEDDSDALVKVGLQTRKLLRGCSSIKRLELWFLSKAFGKSNRGLFLPIFDKLEYLDVKYYMDVEGLLGVLHATPYLKFLNFFNTVMWEDYDLGVEKCVPSCVVSCLENVTVSCYLEDMAPQYEVVKFLVENGAVLKTLCFYKHDEAHKDEINRQLSTFSKASSCLEIVLDPRKLTYLEWEKRYTS